MNQYTVHHRIDTLLWLKKPFAHEEISFSQWDTKVRGQKETRWLATKNIEAESVNDAYQEFTKHLFPLIDLIAVAGQAHTSVDHQPFAITKENEDIFYCRYFRPNITSLTFGEDQIKSLTALRRYKPKGDPFRALSEAIRATTGFTRLVMLAASMEGFAGEIQKNQTDMKCIKSQILKDESLCDAIFKSGEGVRNIILHGKPFPKTVDGNATNNGQIYDRIIEFLNDETSANLNTKAKGRPRTRGGSANLRCGYDRWVGPDVFCPRLWLEKFDLYSDDKHIELTTNVQDF